jgi:hypothetical protein
MKEALALVTLFEEKLEIPRAEAVKRVIKLVLCLICSLVAIGLAIAYFPYAPSFTEEFPLLPGGNHVQVSKILDGEVLVDRTQFLKVAEGSTTFISIFEGKMEENVIYMTKVEGVSYRYEQSIPAFNDYSISSFHVKNGVIVIEMERKTGTMIGLYIILPFCVVAIMFLFSTLIQSKRMSGFGSSAVYNGVWF